MGQQDNSPNNNLKDISTEGPGWRKNRTTLANPVTEGQAPDQDQSIWNRPTTAEDKTKQRGDKTQPK